MLGDERDEYAPPPRPLWQRAVLPALGVALVFGGGVLLWTQLHRSAPSPRPHQELHILAVRLPPPPPPPPPPKTPPPPTKTTERTRAPQPTKLAQPKPKAPPAPPAAVTTSIQGNGPGALTNGNGGGGDCIGEGCGTGGGGGDPGEYYKSLVDSAVQQALSRDEKLRYARFAGVVALLFDSSGHAISVKISNFEGEPEVRSAIVRDLQQLAAGESLPTVMTNNGNPWVVRISAHARG